MRETANSRPAGAHGAAPAARRRRHPVWLEMPLRPAARVAAHQGFSRRTSYGHQLQQPPRRAVGRRPRCKNCHFGRQQRGPHRPPASQHAGAPPRCKPPAAAGGVDVWHQLCVRLCAPPQSTPRRLLTFRAGAAPEVRLNPSCMARTTFVGGPFALQLRSNYGPTSPNFARFSRSVAAGTGPTSPRRTPTGGPTRPKLDPNMPKL